MAVFLTLWMVFIHRYGIITPVLKATSVLQFDNPDDLSAVTERVPLQADTRAALIKSHSFLEQVAQDVSLRVRTGRYVRSVIFDSVYVSESAPSGEFKMQITDSSFNLSGRAFGSNSTFSTVLSGQLSDLQDLSFNNISLYWSEQYNQKPFSFSFKITPLKDAVNYILDNLKIDISGTKQDILFITMQGKDKDLISTIANTIADKFVYTHSLTKKIRRDTILTILEKQLFTAKKDMLTAEAALRKFREQYPTLGLDNAFTTPVEILTLKESEAELNSTLKEGRELLTRYSSVNDSGRTGLMSEMVSFLNRYQTATAQGLQNELILLMSETATLKERYSPHHPDVKRNLRNLELLGDKITNALSALLNDLDRKSNEINDKVGKMNQEINNLPSRQLQLFNLQRRYEVYTEIYSSVLTRYNEARLAESVVSGDVHVVDHAAPPDEDPDIKVVTLIFAIGLFFGFSAGFGPVLALDSIKKTVHTSEDLRHLTELPVLESIPVKGKWHKSATDVLLEKVDDKILEFHEETYRSLRTKILLKLHNQTPKRLLVTSLGTDEGKSFTTTHLGIALSQLGKPTLLIDADLHKGTLHSFLNISSKQGLSEYLTSDKALDSEVFKQTVQTTKFPYLCCITNGEHDQNAHYLLNSDRFRCLLDFASNMFEMILIDTPPFAVVTDALSMQEIVSNYLIVVRSKKTNISELNKKIEEFAGFRKKILGVILNGASYKRMEYYHYTSYRSKKEHRSKKEDSSV
jgi:capsular exopolysaccharide synthesis family protein